MIFEDIGKVKEALDDGTLETKYDELHLNSVYDTYDEFKKFVEKTVESGED